MKTLLIIYDNESYIHHFPLGPAYIASALQQKGHEVEIYHQNVHHYPEEHLTEYLDNNAFDVIGVGVIAGYFQYQKLLEISAAINKSKNRPDHFLLGGHGPSPEPAYFLRETGADIVVMGEGEETTTALYDAIEGGHDLSTVPGIAYRDGENTVVNQRRPLIHDIDSIAWPAYDLFPIEYYRLLRLPHATSLDFVMPVLSARGCTFTCNFCYRMDTGYRARNPEAIMEEIEFLQRDYGINYIDFTDDLLMSSKARVVEVCDAIKKSKLQFKWFCNGRLNYAVPEILKYMKETGCVFINYGIEAFDDQILRNMNKALTTKQIIRGIEATLSENISPGYNIIFGNIGENKRTLRQGVDFLLKYDDGAQMRTIRPVTPYPGSPLYYYAIKTGLLKDVEDFYKNKHVNSDLLAVNFTEMNSEEFHASLMEANCTLIDNYFSKKKEEMKNMTRTLYLEKNITFRGFRMT